MTAPKPPEAMVLRLALASRIEQAKRNREVLTRSLVMHLNQGRMGHIYSYEMSISQLFHTRRSWFDKKLRQRREESWWTTPLVGGHYPVIDQLIAALRDPTKD